MKIERNIPLPADLKTRRGLRAVHYPFNGMKKGDSFFVPTAGDTPKVVMARLRSAIKHRVTSGAFAAGTKFAFEQREEDGVKGIRVWHAGVVAA